jgi:hypothetical protein
MALGGIDLGKELLNVPMGQMIRSMAMAIADAQWSLDKSSMTVAEMMSGRRVLRDLDTGKLITADGKENKTGIPQVLDSRVYFGYSYELDKDNKPIKTPQLLSMMELGFTPTFYQFVDTIIEVKISISIKSETISSSTSESNVETTTDTRLDSSSYGSYGSYSASSSYSRGYNWNYSNSHSYGSHASNMRQDQHQVATSQVNATYANKFGYSAEGASLLRTKLVPVPPPAILEERIHEIMRIEKAYDQWHMLDMMQSQILMKDATLRGADAPAKDDAEAREKAVKALTGEDEISYKRYGEQKALVINQLIGVKS